jgi:hypothetical protein
MKSIQEITSGKIEKDLEGNGKDAIIERELNNFECFYASDIEDCIETLKRYGIT